MTKHTDEHRAKISAALSGVPKSEEHRAGISQALRGNQNARKKPTDTEDGDQGK